MRHRGSSIAALAAILAIVSQNTARGALTGLISGAHTNQAGLGAAGDSSAAAITPDGRFVVFLSSAGNLVTNDDNGMLDVFLRDRASGRTTLVSVSPDGTRSGGSPSSYARISSNGQFIAFQSRANNLTPTATNGWEQIFVRNMAAGQTVLASVSTNNTGGNRPSFNPQLTPDGRFVVFESTADDLVPNDTNKLADIFVRDLIGNTTSLVGMNADGSASARGYSANPSMTPDGRYVAFESTAANLVTNDFNTTSDIFRRDLNAGTTTLISAAMNDTAAGQSQNAAISDDGRLIAFDSTANNLVIVDADGLSDIFVRFVDVYTPGTRLVSSFGEFNTSTNVPRLPVISHDGSLIAFQTGTLNTGSFTVSTNGQVYIGYSNADSNILMSVSRDGSVFGAGVSHSPTISADNRIITFLSNATNLVSNATAGTFQIYQRLIASVTTLVSANSDGTGNNTGTSGFASSDDGLFVTFDSTDGGFAANDGNNKSDVFVRDTISNSTELISVRLAELASATADRSSSVSPNSVSADGRLLVFTSLASDLVSNDTNGTSDVYLRDLLAGTNSLLSVNTNGVAGNGASRDPVISADGQFVVFRSLASDLTSGVTNRKDQIYLRDLSSGATILASASTNGLGSNGDCSSASISSNGDYVAFASVASDLDSKDPTLIQDVYVFNRRSGTNSVVSVSWSGFPGSAASQNPLITPEGQKVVFESAARNLMTNTTAFIQLFVRDLSRGSTTIISPGNDAASVRLSDQPLSSDGRMVAFQGPTNSYVCDLHLGTAHLITSDGINPVISGDGRFVAFERPRRNGLIITNYDIVVIDALFDVESLASINIMGTGGGNGPSRSPVLSSDGRFVVFKSQATDLVSGDNNGVTDLFVRDMVLGQSMLVSLNQSGMSGGNRLSGNPVMGADGHTVIFESFASDLTSNDFNESKDLFALRLGAGDSDNDGMDDAWEISYFGNLSRDGTADSDNDGATELAEFKAGTNPINDSSVLSVVTLQNIGTGAVSVLWNSVPGKSYVVQFKSGLEEPEWQSLPGSVVADGSTASKADASAQADDHRYYRVVLASP